MYVVHTRLCLASARPPPPHPLPRLSAPPRASASCKLRVASCDRPPSLLDPEYFYPSKQANSQKTPAMNFFGQKEEKPAGPDPLFAGACFLFFSSKADRRCVGRPRHALRVIPVVAFSLFLSANVPVVVPREYSHPSGSPPIRSIRPCC